MSVIVQFALTAVDLLLTLKMDILLQPNKDLFPCASECPLTLAVQLEESCELIKVLRNGGAHLDFRTRDGITALHRAVLCRNSAALTVRKHFFFSGSVSMCSLYFESHHSSLIFVGFSQQKDISAELFHLVSYQSPASCLGLTLIYSDVSSVRTE